MPKYSDEFKLEVIKDYLSGKNGGSVLIAKKYGIPVRTVNNWINWYNARGKHGLIKKLTTKSYSSDFKLSVIKYREINKCSYREAAEHFGVTNGAIVYTWAKKYEEKGFSGLEGKQGRSRKVSKSKNPKPLNESEREELIRLREEVKYLKLKEIYKKKLEALLEEMDEGEYQPRPKQK